MNSTYTPGYCFICGKRCDDSSAYAHYDCAVELDQKNRAERKKKKLNNRLGVKSSGGVPGAV